ncbi:MAG: FAD-dependent oxidoreductase [Ruminococcaceae bacterium]|nr:FAD-dependent oxidoreductase [Oscillospiraceae bacterium]
MKSVWEESVEVNSFERLKGDKKTDVLIIGGGLAGILCAYMLKQKGVDYILVESQTLCNGTTKNTTAKITAQHGLIYDKIINNYGVEKARQYLDINLQAIDKYREMCKDIDCHFENKDNYVYSLNDRKKIEKEIKALEKIGYKADFVSKTSLPFGVAGAVRFKNQAQFNVLEFVQSISKGLNIYEHTTVNELVGTTAYTNYGKITAKKLIVATHFPFINKHGSYFLKMYQHRSYVIALENAADVNGMYVDEDKKGLSFRNYGNMLLLGGGSHRTGKEGGNWQELRGVVSTYYPSAKEKYHWATQDCMTLDGISYIGEYSGSTENMYVATGFNKWGMTSSMVSAMILCDMVQGKKNPYSEVFSPSRSMLHPQLAVNAFEATVNLLTPTTKRCSHLGCALKWNPIEHTWDCPCHGSRFNENGRLIDNPATKNIKIK